MSFDIYDEKQEVIFLPNEKGGDRKWQQNFCSKQSAIIQGLDYAGRSDLHKDDEGNSKYLEDILKNQEIKVVDDVISHFGHVHEDSLMIEFLNSDKKVCRIATTEVYGRIWSMADTPWERSGC